ncbi:MAG TPA: FAD-binding domain-containing protein [Nevskiaceae bacterium]|nr:FAD-binding domain-containing protein [Nevskiaceae bacterium]
MTRATLPLPRRDAGLEQLQAFVPQMGSRYARERNEDRGPGQHAAVSRLSPLVRHRLLLEAELVSAALGQHRAEEAEKFIQEVCWRSYWKGWLQQHPEIWSRYRQQQALDHAAVTGHRVRAAQLAAACAGDTGLPGFDDWARELLATGYLHNHARMWFASIWIFTLRLPWTLGADFFLRHLLDADAASNTLSWRWVAGLQTRGKHYLARAENIHRYTRGRYALNGRLDETADPLPADDPPPRVPLASLAAADPGRPSALLLHGEDLHLESLLAEQPGRWTALPVLSLRLPPPAGSGAAQQAWREAAQDDAEARLRAAGHPVVTVTATELEAALAGQGARQLLLAELAQGELADALQPLLARVTASGVSVRPLRRRWDAVFWPHATRGFFALRERIPALLQTLGLLDRVR